MLTLYHGGKIITMTKKMYAEAIVTNDDTIVFKGTLKSAKRFLANKTYNTVNLNNCTLMPSFIEAHAHFNDIVYNYLSIDASDFYYLKDLLKAISDFIRSYKLEPGQWVTVRRFDHMRMQGQQYPLLAQLDAVAPENPVVIQHINNRMGIFNSKAYSIAQQNYDDPTIVPQDGYLTQAQYLKLIYTVATPSEQSVLKAVQSAQKQLIRRGVTTATDCILTHDYMSIMRQLIDTHTLQMDVAIYVESGAYEGYRRSFENTVDNYHNGVRLAGIGVMIDGELHHQTARVNYGYANDQQNNGVQLLSNNRLMKVFNTASKYGAQLVIQANGDVAVKQALWCYSKLDASIYRRARMSPILAHAHFVEPKQLQKMRRLHISPSYLIEQLYKYGDINLHLLGSRFYYHCYPLQQSQNIKLNYTLCRDVADVNSCPLTCVQNAVLRTTKGGFVLNPSEKVSVLDALKALTINAAKALKEDDKKGQLRRGRKADMVILSDDPMDVAERKISQIQVLQTIKDGVAIYTSKEWQQDNKESEL